MIFSSRNFTTCMKLLTSMAMGSANTSTPHTIAPPPMILPPAVCGTHLVCENRHHQKAAGMEVKVVLGSSLS